MWWGRGVITLVWNKEAGVPSIYIASREGLTEVLMFPIYFSLPHIYINNNRSLRKRSVLIKQLKQRKIFEISLSDSRVYKKWQTLAIIREVSVANLESPG